MKVHGCAFEGLGGLRYASASAESVEAQSAANRGPVPTCAQGTTFTVQSQPFILGARIRRGRRQPRVDARKPRRGLLFAAI